MEPASRSIFGVSPAIAAAIACFLLGCGILIWTFAPRQSAAVLMPTAPASTAGMSEVSGSSNPTEAAVRATSLAADTALPASLPATPVPAAPSYPAPATIAPAATTPDLSAVAPPPPLPTSESLPASPNPTMPPATLAPPTTQPTVMPTLAPTAPPTVTPTLAPTAPPTVTPTLAPTALLMLTPTAPQTMSPTIAVVTSTAMPAPSPTDDVDPPTSTPTPATQRVTYRVEGTAPGASILYFNGTQTVSVDTARFPWSIDLTMASDAPLLVAAENTGDTGTLRCLILVQGKSVPVAEHSSPLAVNCETSLD